MPKAWSVADAADQWRSLGEPGGSPSKARRRQGARAASGGLPGELDHRAAAAAPNRFGRREHATVGEELNPGRGPDLAAVNELLSARQQQRRPRAQDEGRLGARTRGVALARARVGNRIRKRRALVQAVKEDLQHCRDNRRATRRAEREERLAVVEDDRRAHRTARALAP